MAFHGQRQSSPERCTFGPWKRTLDSKMTRERRAGGMVVFRGIFAMFGRFVMFYFSFGF